MTPIATPVPVPIVRAAGARCAASPSETFAPGHACTSGGSTGTTPLTASIRATSASAAVGSQPSTIGTGRDAVACTLMPAVAQCRLGLQVVT